MKIKHCEVLEKIICDEQINEAIENGVWKIDVGGVYICTVDECPRQKHINGGLCDTLKELFGREVVE